MALPFSPRSRSDATQMALRPCSRISPRHRQQVAELAQARQLHQHRQVHAGDHFDAASLEKRHREIGRRAAKHVGQHDDARARRATRAMACAISSRASLHVVVPADRDGREMRQVADDRLGRVHQLRRELPVRHDHHADHGSAIGSRVASAGIDLRIVTSVAPRRDGARGPARLEVGQRPPQRFGEHHRAVPAARAADGDRQVALPSAHVLRHEEPQQVRAASRNWPVDGVLSHERHDAPVLAGLRLQRGHEVRVRQEAHVEHEVGVERHAVLEAEAQERDEQRTRCACVARSA